MDSVTRNIPTPDPGGMDAPGIIEAFAHRMMYSIAKDRNTATDYDIYRALALAVRDRLMERWFKTQNTYYVRDAKRVYYLSLEFLMGRALQSNVLNLGTEDAYTQALGELGLRLEDLREQEWDAGLGNGGLGRLAACILDAAATLELPFYGYGIRYEYGIFMQKIIDGRQVEFPDAWLRYGNPWEIQRPDAIFPVHFHGHTEAGTDAEGRYRVEWSGTQDVWAMAYDTPVAGFRNGTVNTLRLWSAKSSREFDLARFNSGEYVRAVEDKTLSENISKVLYPADDQSAGKELRLKQQYFFVSATLQDVIRRFQKRASWRWEELPDKVAIQTERHPSGPGGARTDAGPGGPGRAGLGPGLGADPAGLRLHQPHHPSRGAWRSGPWNSGATCCPAMSRSSKRSTGVSGPLYGTLPLRRRQAQASGHHRRWPQRQDGQPGHRGQPFRQRSGPAAHGHPQGLHLHRNERPLPGPDQQQDQRHHPPSLAPEVQPGAGRPDHRSHWRGLDPGPRRPARADPFAGDAGFQERWTRIKRANKEALADWAWRTEALALDPDLLFDVQVKRIHEYKRQLLNLLHVATLWNRLKDGADTGAPRAALIGGKAAPAYWVAKDIIHLTSAMSRAIQADSAARGRLSVAFLPNYRVSLAERVFPAAELSEQISTAGTEASGTGNMKAALNGALTIGTLDGANIEIMEEVGEANIFIFGHTAEGVIRLRDAGHRPGNWIRDNPELARAIATIAGLDGGRFQSLAASLTHWDHYLLCADYASYVETQERVSATYADPREWARMSILNVSGMGKFSIDRTVREYARDIWTAPFVPIPLP